MLESLFEIVRTGVLGFVGLLGTLFVLAFLFGKRVEKQWEYEADFLDARGREIGEFDIESSRIVGEGSDYALRAKLVLRHPGLVAGAVVQVHLDAERVMEGVVEKPGRVRLGLDHLTSKLDSPRAGQVCSVRCGDQELVAEPLARD